MSGRTRMRVRVALAAVLGLLFQQIALAAYSCPVEPAAAAAMAVASAGAHCTGDSAHLASDNPALCAGHCAAHTPAPSDASLKAATAVWAPAPAFVTTLPPAQPVQAAVRSGATAPVPDLPPRFRYCSLLI